MLTATFQQSHGTMTTNNKRKHDYIMNSKQESSSSSMTVAVHLPPEIIIEHVIPFLDRQSLCRIGRTCKDFLKITKQGNLPWPTCLVPRINDNDNDNDNESSKCTMECLAFSPDGRTLAAGSSDGRILRWDVETGALPPLDKGHFRGGRVVAISYSKDGKWLASADSTMIVIWNNEDGTVWKRIDAPDVTCLSYSPKGNILASGHSRHECIKLWNLKRGVVIDAEFRGGAHGKIMTMEISEDSRHIRSTSDDGSIKLWDISKGTYQFWVGGHNNAIAQAVPCGDVVIASLAHDQSHLMLWNRKTRELVRLEDSDHPVKFIFSPNAKKLASTDTLNTIKIWNVGDGGRIKMSVRDDYNSFSSIKYLAYSSDSKVLATISGKERLVRLIYT